MRTLCLNTGNKHRLKRNGEHSGRKMNNCFSRADMNGSSNQRPPAIGPNIGVVLEEKPKTRKPSMYRVLMLNDDYTPMEFVVLVLQSIFGKSNDEAMNIMLHVHQKGVGVCGIYTFELAETKVTQVMDLAQENQHPLQCTLEKE